MTKHNSQAGFSAIEVLLVLILVAIVGFTGFYIYNANNKSYDAYDQASESSSTITPKTKTTTSPTTDTVQTSTFANLPKDLRTAVLAHATCANSKGQLTAEGGGVATGKDNQYVANQAAFIGECSTKALYAYTAGEWQFIDDTQDTFTCADFTKYNVPVKLVTSAVLGDCLNASGKVVTYQ